MNTALVATVLRPIALLLLVGLVLYPARLAVKKWFPEGKIKRLLLRRVN